jgi:hypothetical protein
MRGRHAVGVRRDVGRRLSSVLGALAVSVLIAGAAAPAKVADEQRPALGTREADSDFGLVVNADDLVCCDGRPAYDSVNTDGQAGSGTGATVYKAGGPGRHVIAPDPLLWRTGYGGWEPTLGITRAGTIFYAARNSNVDPEPVRSRDGGKTWVAIKPTTDGAPTHTASVDPYLWVDTATGRVFDSDLGATLTCSPVSFTDDGGANWTTVPECGEADHQTVFGGPPPAGGAQPSGYANVVYFCAISGGVGAGVETSGSTATECSKSLDGGLTYPPTGDFAYPPRTSPPGSPVAASYCDGASGHGFVDPKGTVFLPRGWCGEPYLAISRDEGATWTRVRVASGPLFSYDEAAGAWDHDSSIDEDSTGNLFYLWVGADLHPYLIASRDGGKSWTRPVDVVPPGVTRTSMPQLAAGGAGRIALIFMGTTAPAGTSSDQTTWNGYLVESANALDKQPTFYAATVNDPATNPLWRGGCPPIRCGNVGDFLDVTIDSHGTAWGAFVDSCPGVDNACTEFAVTTPRGEGIVGELVGGPRLR